MSREKNKAVQQLEEKLIERSLKILGKKRISRTEEKVISNTIQLIQFTHGPNSYYMTQED